MMKFPPKSKAQDANYSELHEGLASFEVVAYFDTDKDTGMPLITKSGNPKVSLLCILEDRLGNRNKKYIHLAANYRPKIEELCSAVGRPELCTDEGFNYKALKGAEGQCMLVMHDVYGLQIDGFIYPKKHEEPLMASREQQAIIDDAFDDDIPF